MPPVTVRPGASGNLSYFWGFSALSQNTFVCCVPACTSPVAVRLQYSLFGHYTRTTTSPLELVSRLNPARSSWSWMETVPKEVLRLTPSWVTRGLWPW